MEEDVTDLEWSDIVDDFDDSDIECKKPIKLQLPGINSRVFNFLFDLFRIGEGL